MMRWIPAILRVLLGGFFIFTGVVKLLDPLAFAELIFEYDVFPMEVCMATSRVLPLLEILSGLALLSGYMMLGGAVLIGVMNAVFAVMVGSAYARGLSVDCGCFTGSGKTSPWHVAFNLALCGACVYIYWSASGQGKMAQESAVTTGGSPDVPKG